ncbi:MAG TPA: hypothetical protein VM010_08440, partial [Chitinophagaceae bacterium]|nr:hypothetical protein [Chitinophagaceae bacterium]
EGRGTDKPFQIFGHPALPKTMYAFTPAPRDYAKEYKPYNQLCYGWNVSGTSDVVLKKINGKIQLQYLIEAYKLFPDKARFFYTAKKENAGPNDYFFNKLAGNATLMQQIRDGKTEAQIRASWQSQLKAFKIIRKKYLLYPDFE